MSELADQINALPEPLRDFVYRLETNADPSGNIREVIIARETIAALIKQRDDLAAMVAKQRKVVDAAKAVREPPRLTRANAGNFEEGYIAPRHTVKALDDALAAIAP